MTKTYLIAKWIELSGHVAHDKDFQENLLRKIMVAFMKYGDVFEKICPYSPVITSN